LSSPKLITFAQRLDEARKAARLGPERKVPSKADLARETGRANSSVGAWFSGEVEPSLADIAKLGDYLGVSLLWLAFGRGKMREGRPPTPAAALLPVDKLPEVIQVARAGSPRRRAKPG